MVSPVLVISIASERPQTIASHTACLLECFLLTLCNDTMLEGTDLKIFCIQRLMVISIIFFCCCLFEVAMLLISFELFVFLSDLK